MFDLKVKSLLLTSALVSTLVLSACGGGGSSTDTIANPKAAAGTISGLGSIVVNGVRYETLGASVLDIDDHSTVTTALGMGMSVSVEPKSGTTNQAAVIEVHSGIHGTIEQLDANTKTLVVAGLPVSTDSSTVIVLASGAVGSWSALGNQAVEVYGLPQGDGSFKAGRIEIKTSAVPIRLLGVVSNWDAANARFVLGAGSNTVSVSYASLATAPAGLANGAVVSVRTTATSRSQPVVATQVYVRASSAAVFTDYATKYKGTSGVHNEVNELYGMVTNLNLSGTGCTLQVQSVPVSLASTTLCASLKDGDYVEVKGLFANGILVAHRVEFETTGSNRDLSDSDYSDDLNDDDHDEIKHRRIPSPGTDNSSSNNQTIYEIYGVLSNCTSTTCTLTANGVALTADISTTVWEHGTVVTSGRVEAKGYMTSATTFKVLKMEAKR